MRTSKHMELEAVSEREKFQEPPVTAFICANCGRPGKAPTSAGRTRPNIPDFEWPFPVRQIVVPCAGRIQPEHLLKAFEAGADLVTVIACDEKNCHYIEGSKRCLRRIEFIGSVLEEIGLGEERLQLSILPGSAAEDMLATAGKKAPDPHALAEKVAAVRDRAQKALDLLPPNPLRLIDVPEAPESDSQEGLDTTDENENK